MTLQIIFPRLNDALKGISQRAAIRYGMHTEPPLRVSGKLGPEGTPDFAAIQEALGKPYLTRLALEYPEQGQSIVFEEALLSVTQERQIITTALQGKNGTVKEYISDGDYAISVAAGVSSAGPEAPAFDYPYEAMQALAALLAIPATLNVKSDFLLLFGIQNAVVKGYSLAQETYSNRQSLQIQLLSDEIYEIQLADND